MLNVGGHPPPLLPAAGPACLGLNLIESSPPNLDDTSEAHQNTQLEHL